MALPDNTQLNYYGNYSSLGNFSTWGGDGSSLGSFAQPVSFLNAGLKKPMLGSPKINFNLDSNLTSKIVPSWQQSYQSGLNQKFDFNSITQPFNAKAKGKSSVWADAGSSLKQIGKDFGQDMLNSAPEVGETAIKALGVKEADNVSGIDKGFQTFTTGAFKTAMKTGNPVLIAGASVLKGLDFLNRFGGKTTKKQGTTDINTGSYTTLINDAAGKKRTLRTSGRGTMRSINTLTAYDDRLNMMAASNTRNAAQDYLASANSTSAVNSSNQWALSGGLGTKALIAKKGAKIKPSELRSLVKKAHHGIKINKSISFKDNDFSSILSLPQKFQNGGQMNVIPDGALHARKNNLPDDISEKVTNKGIPVVTYEDGGDIRQHAEIEVNEIIFNKEATDKFEDLFKQWKEADDDKKKELSIECGKFLASEILENTMDNTGLINIVE